VTTVWERAGLRLFALALVALVAWELAGNTGNLVRAVRGTPATPGPPPASSVRLPGREVRVLASPHIPYIGAPHAPYDSNPPTSGPHVPWTVAPGIYGSSIPWELQVHALEHGHVVIQYRPGFDGVATLEGVARRYPADVVLAPRQELPAPVALTAWGRLELLQSANRGAIERFVVALRGRYVHGWRR
jgi:hypothetical protein